MSGHGIGLSEHAIFWHASEVGHVPLLAAWGCCRRFQLCLFLCSKHRKLPAPPHAACFLTHACVVLWSCVHYHYCGETPNREQFKGGRDYSDSSLRGSSPSWSGSHGSRNWVTLHPQSGREGSVLLLSSVSTLFSLAPQPIEFRVGLPGLLAWSRQSLSSLPLSRESRPVRSIITSHY